MVDRGCRERREGCGLGVGSKRSVVCGEFKATRKPATGQFTVYLPMSTQLHAASVVQPLSWGGPLLHLGTHHPSHRLICFLL